MKEKGILLPIFSLPTKYGIGDFGYEAYEFIDILHENGMTYWNLLPICANNNLPYSPTSYYALEEDYISLDLLKESGLIIIANSAGSKYLKDIYGEYHWDESMDSYDGYYTYNNDKLKEFEHITKNICKEMISKDMSEINGLFKYLKDNIDSYKISVDHCEDFREDGECREFIDKIYKDADFYKRFLFSKDSYITVGGDEYRGYNIKTIGFEYDYDEDFINEGTKECPKYKEVGEFWDKLDKYEETHDVYLKGN